MVVLTSFKRSVICIGSFLFTAPFLEAVGFDNSRSDNLAVYYGQNSYGATHSDTANWQKTLSAYCQDDTINAIPLAFLHVFFSAGGLPEIDLASTCNSNGGNVFPGTRLARCPTLAGDIKACQARGKIVTISLGGATGLATFSSDAQARTFAETVWNLFLGGTSSTRPFVDAILDGVDLDIEGGTGKGLAAFVTRIRELSNGASKRYYITAAPQCPFPDAYLGSAISAVGFDAIYVQFYNNYCGANNYNNPNAWNFATWDNWAKTTSPNKNIKVYIGAPAASSAAGSGYIDAATLGRIAQETRSKYSSFGGIMLWDASQAYGNGRYDVAIKNAIGDGGATPTDDPDEECPAETTTTTKRSSTSVSTRTSTSKISSTTSRTSTKTSSTTPRTSSTTSRISSTTSRTSSTTSRTSSMTSRTSSTTSKPSSTTTTSTRSSITTSTKTSSSPTSTPTQGSGSCAGVSSWSSYTIYIGANRVTHGGHLWTAKWWSLADTPGGGAGVWADNGACSSAGGTGAVTTSNTPAPTSGADSCSGTAAWGAGVTYVGGNKAVYNGHLWTAKWWAQGDIPGGRAGVWTDNGACSASTARRRRRRSRVFRY